MPPETDRAALRSTLATAAPLAITIGAYGLIFGAGAREPLGPLGTMFASTIIFSGSIQFALLGLILAGATWSAILVTALLLNARHVVLGAALRPSIDAPTSRRFGLAWWMVDEAAALALADAETPRSTLMTTGILFYSSWIVGTAGGLLIGGAGDIASVAQQIAPVLFIGLVTLVAHKKRTVARALVTAAATYLVALAWPEARGALALVVACVIAIPGSDE